MTRFSLQFTWLIALGITGVGNEEVVCTSWDSLSATGFPSTVSGWGFGYLLSAPDGQGHQGPKILLGVRVGGSGNWEGLGKLGHDLMDSGIVRRGLFVHGRLAVPSQIHST